MKLTWRSSCAAVALIPCAGSGSTNPRRDCVLPEPIPWTSSAIACYEKEAVSEYLASLNERVLKTWDLPSGLALDRCAIARFSIRENGDLATEPEVVVSGDSRLTESVIKAIAASAPFPSLPGDAECLAGLPITATFRNPIGE